MANQERYQGTLEQRFANFDRRGIRCDANNRNCVNPAIIEYTLLRADGTGNPLPDALPETKRSCARHRLVYAQSGSFKVLDERDLPRAPRSQAG